VKANVRSGRRRVRLILASVPFGYRSPEHEEADLAAFRELRDAESEEKSKLSVMERIVTV